MDTYSQEQLGEFLELWRRPGGVLSRDQVRALLAWSETPTESRTALEVELTTLEQSVSARPLAPNQRRGHNSLWDRVRGIFHR